MYYKQSLNRETLTRTKLQSTALEIKPFMAFSVSFEKEHCEYNFDLFN